MKKLPLLGLTLATTAVVGCSPSAESVDITPQKVSVESAVENNEKHWEASIREFYIHNPKSGVPQESWALK